MTRAPNLLSFRGVPSPPSRCFRRYFHPLFTSLRGYQVFRAASPSQAVCEDSDSYFECGIWILTVKCNAFGFSHYYDFQNQRITMLENIGYITVGSMALLPRTCKCYLCLTRGKPFTLFHTDTVQNYLESKHTPHQPI